VLCLTIFSSRFWVDSADKIDIGEMRGTKKLASKLASDQPGVVGYSNGVYGCRVVYTIGSTILAKRDFVNEIRTVHFSRNWLLTNWKNRRTLGKVV